MSYLGLDLGATNVKGALVDDEGRVLAHASEPLGDGAATLAPEAVADALARVAQSCVRDWAAVRAVGVGAPGAIEGDVITGCANLFRGSKFPVPLAALVAARLRGKRVILVNDADAAALAERWVGAARGFERAAVLTLGTGVGCGLFLGGDVPLRDVEAGHASVGGPDGRPCPCGARGCLEAYAAAPAIVKAYGDEAVTCGDPCGNQPVRRKVLIPTQAGTSSRGRQATTARRAPSTAPRATSPSAASTCAGRSTSALLS